MFDKNSNKPTLKVLIDLSLKLRYILNVIVLVSNSPKDTSEEPNLWYVIHCLSFRTNPSNAWLLAQIDRIILKLIWVNLQLK